MQAGAEARDQLRDTGVAYGRVLDVNQGSRGDRAMRGIRFGTYWKMEPICSDYLV